MNETLFLFVRLGEILGQELQSDKTVESGVMGFVDNAHATSTDFFEDLVVGYGFTNHEFLSN